MNALREEQSFRIVSSGSYPLSKAHAMFLRIIFSFCFCLLALPTLFSPRLLLADETPAAFVERIISTMKSEKNAAAVVEFIHWPSAFESIPVNQRKEMGVNSPEELKAYLDGMLRSPSTAMRAMMTKRVQTMGPKGQAAAEAAMQGMIAEVEKQEKDLVGKIERANYTIGKVVEKDDTAEVELTTELDGQKRMDPVHIKKIDGKWYLPTVNSMGGSTAADVSKSESPVGQ